MMGISWTLGFVERDARPDCVFRAMKAGAFLPTL